MWPMPKVMEPTLEPEVVASVYMKNLSMYLNRKVIKWGGHRGLGPALVNSIYVYVYVYVMVALPNIGGALCSMPQSLADAHY